MNTEHLEHSKKKLPRVLRIEPASKCNLACTHCPTGTIDQERGLMTKETFANVLRSLVGHEDYVKVVVLYHGGEPLLNKRFFSMVEELRKYLPMAHFKTVSNGMVLTKVNISKILESSLNAIEFSLDGLSPAESEKIRINSDTNRILNNINDLIKNSEKFYSSKLKVSIATTQFIEKKVFPVNEPKTPEWLRKIFGNKVAYKPTYALKWPHMEILNSQESKGGLYDLVQDPDGEDSNACDHLANTITIRANGDVVPCCYDLTSKLVMGNVNSQNLFSIWSSQKYDDLRNSIMAKNYQSICASCAVVRPPVYLIPTWR